MNLKKWYLKILFTNANFVERFNILLQIFYQKVEDEALFNQWIE